MEEDIEVLDFGDDIIPKKPKQTVNKVTEKPKASPKKTKKKKVKARALQGLFCLVSAIFIIGCCVFYGLRFIKYYRIYNPKIDSISSGTFLANDIIGKTEYATGDEDGLFSSSGNYIYKGNVKNNYLKYNNMLWRIIRINQDKSIDIILDDYISILPWNKEVKDFKETDIFKYLNNDFLKSLDKEMLITTSFCTDEINDLTKITCEKQDSDNYVKLLDVANYLNSIKNSKSYLVNDDEIFWLSDKSSEKVWHTNGTNVSQSEANTFYEIRPVVRLKETIIYKSGDGTIEKPYEVGEEGKISVGSKVVLDNDKWIVYDMSNNIKLMREDVIEKQLDFDKEKLTYDGSSLMEYLNTTYLDSLSYKKIIIDDTWNIGAFKDSIDDIKNVTVKAKVGIPNILDIKFDSNVKTYFTSTNIEDRIMVYENPLRPSRTTTYRSIRPCIAISKNTDFKYSDGLFKVGE